jgi:hypothetical protein
MPLGQAQNGTEAGQNNKVHWRNPRIRCDKWWQRPGSRQGDPAVDIDGRSCVTLVRRLPETNIPNGAGFSTAFKER